MRPTPLQRLALRCASACYRLGLLRYSPALRRDFGAEMVEAFDRLLSDGVRAAGWRGLFGALWRVLRDWLRPLGRAVGRVGVKGIDPRHGEGGRMRTFGEDMGFAARSLVREPKFTGLIVSVLGVGLALVLAVFAVVDAYLIEPLPFPESDRLVGLTDGGGVVSWDETGDVFDRSVSWDLDVFTVVGDGHAELLRGAWITPDFLDMYGIVPALGRGFRPEEAGRDGAPVAMISHAVWQGRFGGDPEIVGRSFRAFTSDRPDHSEQFTIVGVLPEDFWYVNAYTEVFAPIRSERAFYTGRLMPGVPIEHAERVLTEIAIAKMDDVPEGFRVGLQPLKEAYVGSTRPMLLSLQSGTLLVLLIACANAGVLLLVRSARRRRELGVRRALGASEARLWRQLLLEGLGLAAVAGLLAAGLATWGLAVTREGLEATIGRSVPGGIGALSVDATAWLVGLGLCAAVGVGFGLVPMLSDRVTALAGVLRDASGGASETRTRRRARSAIVAAEIALSLALLTGAGLMVRSALHLQSLELGFDAERVVRTEVGLRSGAYPEPGQRIAFFDALAERVEALPGVESVGLASMGLFTTRFNPRLAETEVDGALERVEAVRWWVGPRYRTALGIELLRGRDFGDDDVAGSEPVALVSERLGRDLFGEDDPVGQRVRVREPDGMGGIDADEPVPAWARVIGVVADVQREVSGSGAGDLYLNYRQAAPLWMNVMVRRRAGSGDPIPELSRIVGEMDSESPLFGSVELEGLVVRATTPTRTFATLLGGFALFALAVTVLGLYGVIAYAVRQRRRDVAIRMALGSSRLSVTRLFLREGAWVVGAGVGLGLLGGKAFGEALSSQLHGVEPGDPLTMGGLAVVLAAAGLAAVWLPARGASRTDPMEVLRQE